MQTLEQTSKHFDTFDVRIDMSNLKNVASVSKTLVVVIVVGLFLIVLVGIVFFLIRRHQKNFKFTVHHFDKIVKKKYVDF